MNRAILLFGYPGSGKGTQGRILSSLPGFRHVSTGDIFRGMDPKSDLYDRVQNHLRQGNLVPDDVVMEMLKGYMYHINPNPTEFLVLDGVPRNEAQAKMLAKMVHVIKIFKLSVYDESLLVQRLKDRAQRKAALTTAQKRSSNTGCRFTGIRPKAVFANFPQNS